jgi:hypothetical protein
MYVLPSIAAVGAPTVKRRGRNRNALSKGCRAEQIPTLYSYHSNHTRHYCVVIIVIDMALMIAINQPLLWQPDFVHHFCREGCPDGQLVQFRQLS